MKNWIDPEEEIIRGKRKKPEPKPKAKKANHRHEYVDGKCTKCDKIK